MSRKINVVCAGCGCEFVRQSVNVARSIKLNGAYFCRPCKYADATHYKGTPIHNSYAGAKQRCNNTNNNRYNAYGGRGIRFLWPTFSAFYEDMASTWFTGATLERIDVDGDYCKENCKWATWSEQAHNTRRNIHTEQQVRDIREAYERGATQVELARQYGDSQGNISNIITGRTWKESRVMENAPS